jgi:hypothetical protein
MKIKRIALLLLIVLSFFGCKNLSGKKETKEDHISILSPMKDDFAGKFMIGNIFNLADVS